MKKVSKNLNSNTVTDPGMIIDLLTDAKAVPKQSDYNA